MSSTAQIACNVALGFFLVAGAVALTVFVSNQPSPPPTPPANEVVIVDGCEYLKFRTYQYDAITHKGNCKNH